MTEIKHYKSPIRIRIRYSSHINKNNNGLFEHFEDKRVIYGKNIIKYCEIFVAVEYFSKLKLK